MSTPGILIEVDVAEYNGDGQPAKHTERNFVGTDRLVVLNAAIAWAPVTLRQKLHETFHGEVLAGEVGYDRVADESITVTMQVTAIDEVIS